jgi:hypothetical protein
MRKAALYGLVVVCVCMLFSLSGPSAQKIASGGGSGGGGPAPVSVAVANIKPVQPVQVQKPVTVTGSVAVTNLPLDSEGNLRISSGPPAGRPGLRFVGITRTTFSDGFDGVGVLTLTRACGAEFPATRLCQLSEILLDTIPGPPEWPGLVRVTGAGQILATGGGIGQPSACLRSTGLVMDCSFSNDGPGPWPAACCGE